MGELLGVAGLIGLLISLIVLIVNAFRKRPKKKALIILAICFVCFVVGVEISTNSTSADETTGKQAAAVEQAKNDTGETEQSAEEIPIEQDNAEAKKSEQESLETESAPKPPTKEEMLEAVTEVSYKDLLRTPDKYINQYVVITVKINQVLEGGWLDGNTYYFGHTDNDGYGWYFDDEYCLLDKRVDDSTKLLEDDILKIYGKFTGLQTFKRALTNVDDEVPCVDMLYVEIIGE